MRLIIFALAVAAATSIAAAADFFESVCRVSRSNGRGTGWVFSADDTVCHVLTNRHVVGGSSTVSVEFWQQGHKSSRVPGRVIWRSRNRRHDLAVVEIDLSEFPAGLEPTVIPLAPRGSDPERGETIMTVGCPRASWAQASRGHLKGYRGGHYLLVPSVIPGQSGSPILNFNGTEALGVVTWHSPSRAQSLETVYRALVGSSGATSIDSGNEAGLEDLLKMRCFPDRTDPEDYPPDRDQDTPYPGLPRIPVPPPPTIPSLPNTTKLEKKISALESRVAELEKSLEQVTENAIAAIQQGPLFEVIQYNPQTKDVIDSEPIFLGGELGLWYQPSK